MLSLRRKAARLSAVFTDSKSPTNLTASNLPGSVPAATPYSASFSLAANSLTFNSNQP